MEDPTKCIGSYVGSQEMYRIFCRILRIVQDLKQDPTKCIGCYVGSYEMYRILCRILGIVKDLMQDPTKCIGSYVGSYQMYRILCRIFNRKCVGSYAGSYQFCRIFNFHMLYWVKEKSCKGQKKGLFSFLSCSLTVLLNTYM